MSTLINRLIRCVMMVACVLPLFLHHHEVGAVSHDQVTLHFLENTSGEPKARTDIEVVLYTLPESPERTTAEWLSYLAPLTSQQLEDQLGPVHYQGQPNSKGELLLAGLAKGRYYLRQKNTTNQEVQVVPLIVTLPSQVSDIYVKLTKKTQPDPPQDDPRGSYRFKKVSSRDQSALAGAVFKVTRLEGDQYVPVLGTDGHPLQVSSGQDGYFEVKDLPYGQYYLWEINAPTGYVPLKEAVGFEISPTTASQGFAVIHNSPAGPPPKIIVPNTGDIIFWLLLVAGGLLFAVGYRMSREEE